MQYSLAIIVVSGAQFGAVGRRMLLILYFSYQLAPCPAASTLARISNNATRTQKRLENTSSHSLHLGYDTIKNKMPNTSNTAVHSLRGNPTRPKLHDLSCCCPPRNTKRQSLSTTARRVDLGAILEPAPLSIFNPRSYADCPPGALPRIQMVHQLRLGCEAPKQRSHRGGTFC